MRAGEAFLGLILACISGFGRFSAPTALVHALLELTCSTVCSVSRAHIADNQVHAHRVFWRSAFKTACFSSAPIIASPLCGAKPLAERSNVEAATSGG